MTRVGWRRVLQWLLVILLAWWTACASSCAGGPAAGRCSRCRPAHEQLALGRYLLDAADCAACHTAPGGAPFAGGVPLHSPFGTIHGTNITPDPDHGIGRYTADDFFTR